MSRMHFNRYVFWREFGAVIFITLLTCKSTTYCTKLLELNFQNTKVCNLGKFHYCYVNHNLLSVFSCLHLTLSSYLPDPPNIFTRNL